RQRPVSRPRSGDGRVRPRTPTGRLRPASLPDTAAGRRSRSPGNGLPRTHAELPHPAGTDEPPYLDVPRRPQRFGLCLDRPLAGRRRPHPRTAVPLAAALGLVSPGDRPMSRYDQLLVAPGRDDLDDALGAGVALANRPGGSWGLGWSAGEYEATW